MRKLNRLLSLLMVLSLLISSASQIVFAQDDADASNKTFLPLISGSGSDAEQTDEQVDEPKVLQPVDGSVFEGNTEQTDKATINAVAAAGTGPLHPVSLIVTFDSSFDINTLQSVGGSKIVHQYSVLFNGASLVTMSDQVDAIAHLGGVTGVYLDELRHLDTDATPSFIGATAAWQSLGGQKNAGENVTVGILDSGIWPEHPSVSDPDPSGKAYPAPAVKPGSNGFGPRGAKNTCDFGNTAVNPNDAPFTCNNKLIGAYNFIDTYKAINGLAPGEFDSARDDNGHGTHTATTSAGNGKVAASIFGVPRGLVSGIAPRAHIIAYRVCAALGCYSSDSLAATEQAILDKVNVINFSISGGKDAYGDLVEQGFLKAYANGVFVAASAGNAGPGLDTTDHRGPWVTTVAASTSDRQFASTVTLTADNGDTVKLVGVSVMGGISTPTPVIVSPDPNCDVQAAGTFHGEIVVCNRGGIGRVQKGFNVLQAGAGGMLLRNLVTQDVETDNHFLPAVHLNGPAGTTLMAFLGSHTGVKATFTPGTKAPAQGDVIAGFSSRGGPAQTLGVNKPDITAPGVQILAGASPMHVGVAEGPNGELFQAIAGTSMSSPHIAGAGAILKAMHPDWTPGQIKSAMMTTAKVKGVVKEDEVTPATPYEFGAGRIDLSVAGNPGVTFDETAANYVALKDQLWNANYPSVYHPDMPGSITVQRTAKNVTNRKSEWKLKTTTDKSDWKLIVPEELKVPAGGQATFNITIDARNVPLGQVRHGLIWLKSEKIELHIPVSFVRNQAVVTVNKVCTPTTFTTRQNTTCTISMQNTSFTPANVNLTDKLPNDMDVVRNTLVGGTLGKHDIISFNGTLAGAQPPSVSVGLVDNLQTPAGGYLPLSAFSGSVAVAAGDETISNFTVPAFVYGGETYTRIGIVSDGYLVVGGGTAADVQFVNSNLPNAGLPNNILAPFWTDLNPAFGGTILINVLGDLTNSWIVVDFAGVANYSDKLPNDFEVWIGINGTEDVSFVYGRTSNGEGGAYTVGAENRFGNSGGAIFYNGAGTAPSAFAATQAVDVTSAAGAAGPVKTVSFKLKAEKKGKWQNCAEMTSNLFQGIGISCVNGEVK
ncbi:MAG: S8 family serine peptidase [Caldilineaceae bacterium]